MTIEEKRKALIKYCITHTCNKSDDKMPCEFIDNKFCKKFSMDNCDDELIEKWYDLFFGNTENDAVNHPSHYADGKIECIDYIQDKLTKEEFQGYCKGNALKYISRAGKKNPDKYNEDLQKAIWYLKRATNNGA